MSSLREFWTVWENFSGKGDSNMTESFHEGKYNSSQNNTGINILKCLGHSLLQWTVRLFAKGVIINSGGWTGDLKLLYAKCSATCECNLLHCLWNNIFQHVFKSGESLYIPSKFHYFWHGYIIRDDEPEGTILVTFKSMIYTHQRKICTSIN